MHSQPRTQILWVILPVIFLFTLLAYWPGLSGGFIFDDNSNIIDNQSLHVTSFSWQGVRQAAFSGIASRLGRPVSMLSFWANFYTTGLDPFFFKLTNLLIHCINGGLVFWLSILLLEVYRRRYARELSDQRLYAIALTATAAWLLHPLALTSVLYVVQRMTSLAAAFTLAGLICYLSGRERLERGQRGFPLIIAGLVIFAPLAVLSKENGILLPLFMLVIEATLYQFSAPNSATVKQLKWFFLLTVFVPFLGFCLFLAAHPGWLSGRYTARSFGLSERLMSEARVLWLYLRWIVLPEPAQLGLYHDDVATSTGWLQPVTTLISIILLAGIILTAWFTRRRTPLLAFAVFWFLAGQSLESSIIPLDLAYEHRNYLPMYGPILGISWFLLIPGSIRAPRLRLGLAATWLAVLASVTVLRTNDWGNPLTLPLIMAAHHPGSARSNYDAGRTYASLLLKDPERGEPFYALAREHFERSAQADKNAVNGLFSMILLNQSNGKTLPPDLLPELQQRLSRARLGITIIEPFSHLVEWVDKKAITLPQQTIIGLFESALDNPRLGGNAKAQLLSLLSGYYYNDLHLPQEAVSLAIAATAQQPTEPAHHISLADLAFKLGNYPLAKRELKAAARVDAKGSRALQIARLEQAIDPRSEPR